MTTRKSLATVFALVIASSVAQGAVPSKVICPGNGTDWTNAVGSPAHTESGGIGGADDRNAMDLNRPGDADNNTPVYAVPMDSSNATSQAGVVHHTGSFFFGTLIQMARFSILAICT